MAVATSTIAENLAGVRERVGRACERAGRDPSGVRVVAVTKSVGLEEIRSLVELGIVDIGENRPLELVRRAEAAGKLGLIHWHLVGHLQRNKIRKVLPRLTWVHSVDSVRLVRALAREIQKRPENAGGAASPPGFLLEVNVAEETQKTGMLPEELEAALAACRDEGLEAAGLMTMAPVNSPPQRLRAVFAGLRGLRDRALDRGWTRSLPELSMGMTEDFALAVEEGATMVRIGRALFRERD